MMKSNINNDKIEEKAPVTPSFKFDVGELVETTKYSLNMGDGNKKDVVTCIVVDRRNPLVYALDYCFFLADKELSNIKAEDFLKTGTEFKEMSIEGSWYDV